jgi:hypothetical protein
LSENQLLAARGKGEDKKKASCSKRKIRRTPGARGRSERRGRKRQVGRAGSATRCHGVSMSRRTSRGKQKGARYGRRNAGAGDGRRNKQEVSNNKKQGARERKK